MTDDFPLTVRNSRRAKYLKIRIDAERGEAVLVIPPGCSRRAAADFAARHRVWIKDKLAKIKPRIRFAAGDTVDMLGRRYRIVFHAGENGHYSRLNDGVVDVYGEPGNVHGEVIKQARKIFTNYAWKKAFELAAVLGVKIHDITVKVIKSRYGSCSSLGNINLSLSLAFAPLFVTDMVIAHEVSHLKHMNHGREFRRTLAKLCPDVREADRWLKENAAELRRIVLL